MEKLIENGDVILDGTLTKKDKIKQANCKLGFIEELMEKYHIKDLGELNLALNLYHSIYLFLASELKKETNNGKSEN